ncbi:MAG: 6,7-dimethyl-8-ribityllumazine synthase [Chthoniobacterales bacterium]
MSNALPTRPRNLTAKRNFAIVASQYNPKYVQGLVDFTSKELYANIPNAGIALYQVPGAFEIPLLVQELARRGGVDVIIALGVIIEGETGHAGHVAAAVTDALMKISLSARIPIIHEVLSVKSEEQAAKRCLEPEINRGTEAARAAVHIAAVMADLKEKNAI